jgi:hypothetical protein
MLGQKLDRFFTEEDRKLGQLAREMTDAVTTGFSLVEARPVPGNMSLQKPYRPEEIVRAVRQATEGRPPSKSH